MIKDIECSPDVFAKSPLWTVEIVGRHEGVDVLMNALVRRSVVLQVGVGIAETPRSQFHHRFCHADVYSWSNPKKNPGIRISLCSASEVVGKTPQRKATFLFLLLIFTEKDV